MFRSGPIQDPVLGRVRHPACGQTWYIRPGTYIGYQFAQIVHTGLRAGGSLKAEADRKGDRQGGWMNGIVAFLMAAVFRLALAAVLIPIQIVVTLTQREPAKPTTVRTR